MAELARFWSAASLTGQIQNCYECTFDTTKGQSMNDCDFTKTCETKLGGCLTADTFTDSFTGENFDMENFVHRSGCLDNTEELQQFFASIQKAENIDDIDYNAVEEYFANSTVLMSDGLAGESIFGLSEDSIFELCRLPEGFDNIEACNYNADYNLIDFFTEEGPEITNLGESWTDFYDNLESTDVIDAPTEDFTTDGNEPPEDDVDKINPFEGEDGPSEEIEEDENIDGTEVSEDSSQVAKVKPETTMNEHEDHDTNHGGLTNIADLTDELIEDRKIYIEERKKFLGKIITQAEKLLDNDDC